MKNEKFAATLSVGDAAYTYYPVEQVEGSEKLPYALKVLLENVLRNAENPQTASDLAKRVVEAGCAGEVGSEVEFSPARVLFQDFTGVPVFVDFAVMREACANLGGDPAKINPQISLRPGHRPFGSSPMWRAAPAPWRRTWSWSSSATASAITS